MRPLIASIAAIFVALWLLPALFRFVMEQAREEGRAPAEQVMPVPSPTRHANGAVDL